MTCIDLLFLLCSFEAKRDAPLQASLESQVICAENMKTNEFCRAENIMMDFSLAHAANGQRSFERGFVSVFSSGSGVGDAQALPGVPGVQVRTPVTRMPCDEVESRPVFVTSNDDIYNLGHYFNVCMFMAMNTL